MIHEAGRFGTHGGARVYAARQKALAKADRDTTILCLPTGDNILDHKKKITKTYRSEAVRT